MPVARNGEVRISWEEAGSGEPLLMVMGLGGSGLAWWRLLPHVEPHVRALVVDNRGTGGSDRVSGLLSLDDLVDDLVAVLDAAGLQSAHVIGLSMGGMVAQRLALDHRSRVRSLILGCTTAGGQRGRPPWRLLGASALRPILGPRGTFGIVAPSLYAKGTRSEQHGRIEEDREIRERDATASWTVIAQLAAIAAHDMRGRLGELAGLPVTVIHGAEDRLIPPEHGRALARGIPGARLVMIPACGHMLTTDAEERVAQAVVEHLAAHGGRSSRAA